MTAELPIQFIEEILQKVISNNGKKHIIRDCMKALVGIAYYYKSNFGNELEEFKWKFEHHIICSTCWRLETELISHLCGHIVCKKCYHNSCSVCNKTDTNQHSNFKLNHISSEVLKIFSEFEIKREHANSELRENNFNSAISEYTELLHYGFCEHLIFSSRSYAFLTTKRLQLALEDTELLLRMAWGWKKAHLNHAMVCKALNNLLGCAESLLNALILDSEDTYIQMEMESILKLILTPEYILVVARKSDSSRPISEKKLQVSLLTTIRTYYHVKLKQTLSFISEPTVSSRSCVFRTKSLCSLTRTSTCCDRQPRKISYDDSRVKRLPTRMSLDVVRDQIKFDVFECPLCFRCLISPVALICGHTICRHCLQRSLDYSSQCPLCKCDLKMYYSLSPIVTCRNLEKLLDFLWPLEVDRYRSQYLQELFNLTKHPAKCAFMICTLAFPGTMCNLHIFEPRYRLMLRRAQEVGCGGKFGMVFYSPNNDHGHSEIGSVLDITKVQSLEDGRYNVQSTATERRLRIKSSCFYDGYLFADVEDYLDIPQSDQHRSLAQTQLTHVYGLAHKWYDKLPRGIKSSIRSYYGEIPVFEPYLEPISAVSLPQVHVSSATPGQKRKLDQLHSTVTSGVASVTTTEPPPWLWWVCAVLPIDDHVKYSLFSTNHPLARLETIDRILTSLLAAHSH